VEESHKLSRVSSQSKNLAQVNPETMQLRDGTELKASVGFFQIPKLKEIARDNPSLSYTCLLTLHRILDEWRSAQPTEIRVLSSLTGAIIIVPDASEIYIHQHLLGILKQCKTSGVPIRIGITHGDVEVLEDSDGLMNFIGTPVNVAARLAFSTKNDSLLYENTYTELVRGIFRDKNKDLLHPRDCLEITIEGKLHDRAFLCRRPKANQLALNNINESELLSLNGDCLDINAFVIAYDLPKFSRGDRSQLSKRFRSVIHTIKSSKANSAFPQNSSFYFSPGGDGGILVFRVNSNSLKQYVNTALDFVELLEVESDNKDSNIDVKSRVGLHYGVVNLYHDAEGIERPTGLICFIADEIASDELAKNNGGIVITDQIKGILFSGSNTRFEQEYKSLECLKNGVAKDVNRYVKINFEIKKNPTNLPPTNPIIPPVHNNWGELRGNYDKLFTLLEEKEWKAADIETMQVMLKITKRTKEGWLRSDDIDGLSCSDIQKIDELWSNASEKHFGFKKQIDIWLSVGGEPGGYNFSIFNEFGEQVGWSINGNWRTNHEDFNFSPDAPNGHLPTLMFPAANNDHIRRKECLKKFLSRLNHCF
jgi:GUN4-like